MQPGSTITPGGQDNQPQPPATPVTQEPVTPVSPQTVQPPTPQPQVQVQPPSPAPEAAPTPVSNPTPPATNWEFTANDQLPEDNDGTYMRSSVEPISWTASEYVDHEKNHSWFFAIAGATVVIAVITFVLTRDFISSGVVLLAGALLAASATRKPRTLSFQLNNQGLQVGPKFYEYALFKSFTVLEEGALSSIQLLPARRFMPSLSIYYPPENEDAIISCLGSFLPHEERKRDAVDSLMRRIKF